MSKGLRVIAEPKVVAQPMGVRIRTRLRTSQEDLDVLLQIGEHLGSLARKDLVARVRLGNTREDGRATRKQALTADSSSRWAGAITRTSNDQWNLSWRALNEHRTSTRRAIAVIEKRLEIPVGERVGKIRGYENREERFGKQQRLQVLKAAEEQAQPRGSGSHRAAVASTVARGTALPDGRWGKWPQPRQRDLAGRSDTSCAVRTPPESVDQASKREARPVRDPSGVPVLAAH